jgi:hypothetical protein
MEILGGQNIAQYTQRSNLKWGKEGTIYTKKAWREIQEHFNDSKVDKLELQQIKNRHKCYRSCFFLNEAKDLPFSLIEQKYRC